MAVNQQEIEKAGIYEAKTSLPSLLADLEQIAAISATVAARGKKKRKLGGWIILAGIIGCVIGAATGMSALVGLGFLLMIAGFIWWIVNLFSGRVLLAHAGRLDIAKQRIAMLQQDASDKAPFTCRLVLSAKPTTLSDEKWPGRKNGKQQLLEDRWLSLEGPLLDGTVVTDEIKDLTRKRTFSTPRGKTKTKVRLTHLVNVRFDYPPKVYGDARPAEKALHGEVQVALSATLRGVKVTEKAIALKATVMEEKHILPTAGMLSVGGYRILNLARKMTAGQQGKTK